MQIIKLIDSLPRKIMLWTVTYGCIYEIIIRPWAYYIKYHYFLLLDWKAITLIASVASVLGVCRTVEKNKWITK